MGGLGTIEATTSWDGRLVSQVGGIHEACLLRTAKALGWSSPGIPLPAGKMLRTRLAERLLGGAALRAEERTVAHVCAATELLHSASLCHDDVIDGGLIRRGAAALWRVTGPSAAVLIGDMLLCEAVMLVQQVGGGRYVGRFVAAMHEVCRSEVEQELRCRGQELDEATCLRLARGKTGPLFGFVCHACGGNDAPLSAALEEAGRRLGTAYQVADDLIDVVSAESAAGKTLGTDRQRNKFTLAALWPGDADRVGRRVTELIGAALACVDAWPEVRESLSGFVRDHLHQVLCRCGVVLERDGRAAP